MILAIFLAMVLSSPTEAKLVKSIRQKAYVAGEPRELPKAARICGETRRTCRNGRKAAIVLPKCERVCPEDGRKDLSCYAGLIDDADESEAEWVEVPEVPGTPVIYSAGSYNPGYEEPSADCDVYEVVKRSAFPSESFRRPAGHHPKKVAPAR